MSDIDYALNDDLFLEGFQIFHLKLTPIEEDYLNLLNISSDKYSVDLDDLDYFARQGAIKHFLQYEEGNNEPISIFASLTINNVIESVLNVFNENKTEGKASISLESRDEGGFSGCDELHIDCFDLKEDKNLIYFVATFKGEGTTYYKFPELNNEKLNKIVVKDGCDKANEFVQKTCHISSVDIIYTMFGEASYHFIGSSKTPYPLAIHSIPSLCAQPRLRLGIFKKIV